MNRLNEVTSLDLDRLNRNTINRSDEIRKIFEKLQLQRVELKNGINRNNDPRSACVASVTTDEVTLTTQNFDQKEAVQLYLNFDLDGSSYFFAATPTGFADDSSLTIEVPGSIYQVERRDVYRRSRNSNISETSRIEMRVPVRDPIVAKVLNSSQNGLGVRVPEQLSHFVPSSFSVRFLDGERRGEVVAAKVRHSSSEIVSGSGWVRLGMSLDDVSPARLIQIERRSRIVERTRSDRAREQLAFAGSLLQVAQKKVGWGVNRTNPSYSNVPIEVYKNEKGHEIHAIVDRWGDPSAATAVVVPPAWGRTKETLLPLAWTILETFKRSNEPIIVVRFDGTNRRGESYISPECRRSGDEYLQFTFSQASRDITATLDFIEKRYGPKNIVLTTFSLAAIEGRHVLASDASARISGWVSAVGMIDLQSALRAISGGIDYAYGLTRGVRFGRHELVGVIADMDHTGLDAIANRMVFLEDACREMEKIRVPITWIHGRDDAWMDIQRVRDVLSCGEVEERRLLEVPTGHQLRTSRIALDTFQLIAEEISEMSLGRRLRGALPRLGGLAQRSDSERNRRPMREVDIRSFWRDYLLGRDRRYGMQLLTATAAYRELMRDQVAALRIASGDRIADLGAGTGEFALFVSEEPGQARDVSVHEIDYVSEALRRGGDRFRETAGSKNVTVFRVIANLNLAGSLRIPLHEQVYDSVLVSLLVSYLSNPTMLLAEAFRLLRPGGSIVLSTLLRDADISKLFVDGLAELKATMTTAPSFDVGVDDFDRLARDFLNDASQILAFEEEGRFRFWEPAEFVDLVRSAGFVDVRSHLSLGDPPQAVVVGARRPSGSK